MSIGRRLKTLGALALGAVLAFGGAVSAAIAQEYSEAPTLTELVNAGKLPPIGERLPKNPMLVESAEVGKYGGTWRMTKTTQDWANLHRSIVYESLVRWDPSYSKVIPNVAESWDVSADSKEITFHLREGMKWSDGDPFDVNDIEFWYKAVATNKELTPSGLPYLTRGGKMADFVRIDDYTFKFVFSEPAGLFFEQLAHPVNRGMTYYPEHYFKQFHPDYTDGVDALVAAAGADSWAQFFMNVKGGDLWNGNRYQPEVPALEAWHSVTPFTGSNTQLLMERNPYYFKVDQAGNQYPYFDSVRFTVIEDAQAMVLMAAAGELDMQFRHINAPNNRAFFLDSAEQGGFHLYGLESTYNNEVAIHFNQTVADPVLREIFSKKDFRIGMSHAVDRQEIIDLLYFGQAQAAQAAPLPNTPFYDEQFANQYLAFDTNLAGEYLDKAGFATRDANGYRLGPDGQPITFVISFLTDTPFPTNGPDVAQMLADYWQAVGVNALARGVTGANYDDAARKNEIEVALWSGFGGVQPVTEPWTYLPASGESRFGLAWAQWYQGIKSDIAEEPTDPLILRQFEIYDELLATVNPDRQTQLTRELLANAREGFWVIGVCTPIPGYGVVRNNVANVPDSMPFSWEYPTFAPINPFAFFFR